MVHLSFIIFILISFIFLNLACHLQRLVTLKDPKKIPITMQFVQGKYVIMINICIAKSGNHLAQNDKYEIE